MMKPRPPRIDDALVEQLLRLEEGRVFEAKRVGPRNDKKLETILAFANTDGGLLVLGLEDAAKAQGRERVYGIGENPESVDELRRLVRTRITPRMEPPDAVEPRFHHVGCVLRDGSKGAIVVVQVE
jgi:ATP-dependent DNA helicase RecG